MKPNELRIGNWVNTDRGIGRVTMLQVGGAEAFQIGVTVAPLQNYVYNNPKAEPIPLTPELLEKCGFKCIAEGRDYFELKDLRIFLHRGDWAVELGIRVSVQYLHQLQNLAYCLGTELNVPLNL